MNLEKQKENIANLLKLIQDNPDLEIVPIVDSDIVTDEGCCYWMAGWGDAYLDKYWCSHGRIYEHDDDFEELIEDWCHSNCDNYPELSDEELEKIAEEHISNLDWKPAIIVCIKSL